MNIDPHWIEVIILLPGLGLLAWFLRRIMKATDTLPVLATKFDEHVKQDDERHEWVKDEIRDIKGGLTPARGTRMPRAR